MNIRMPNTTHPGNTSIRVAICAASVALVTAGCAVDSSPPRVDCDLGQGPCTADTPLGRIVVNVSPRPIAPLSPLQLAVDTGSPLDDVRIELNGRDMDMGPNVARLAALATTRWRGTAVVPVCTTRRMRWDAILVLRLGPRTERVAFGFESG